MHGTPIHPKINSHNKFGIPISNNNSNQPTRSGATRGLVALRLERLCSVLFTPIHLQIRIGNIFGIAKFRYLYGVDTGNQSDLTKNLILMLKNMSWSSLALKKYKK